MHRKVELHEARGAKKAEGFRHHDMIYISEVLSTAESGIFMTNHFSRFIIPFHAKLIFGARQASLFLPFAFSFSSTVSSSSSFSFPFYLSFFLSSFFFFAVVSLFIFSNFCTLSLLLGTRTFWCSTLLCFCAMLLCYPFMLLCFAFVPVHRAGSFIQFIINS